MTTQAEISVPVRSDMDLVQRCARGDEAAWGEFFDRFQTQLLSRVQTLLGARAQDQNLVEEIAAEVWCSLYQQNSRLLKQYKPGKSLLAFLSGIARYEALRYLRSEHRRRTREVRAANGHQQRGDSFPKYTGIDFDEFVEQLTPREKEYLETHLVNVEPNGRMRIARTNHWQLRHRVRQKLCRFLRK